MNGSTSSDSLLQAPVLYVDGLAGSVRDEEIVEVLSECLRLKLNLTRDSSSRQSDQPPSYRAFPSALLTSFIQQS
jgi:hypothetical protein